MWETIREYLTFTRKERFGVLFLLLIICILFVLPYFFKPAIGDPDPEAYEKLKEGIRKFESRVVDSSLESVHRARYPDQKQYTVAAYSEPAVKSFHPEFYFDPNTLNGEEWLRLGLSDRLTHTILHYIEKGGRFRKPEDLKKLYGLRNSDYDRLFPFVRIAKPPEKNLNIHMGYYAKTNYNWPAPKKTDSFLRESTRRMEPGIAFAHRGKNYEITDINLADSAAWARLPGIGAKLASRIVHFREKLGGFYQVDQVGETFGLPDSVFQKIKSSLRLNPASLNQIDLNSATREILQAHPYIRWQLAKEIMEYRQQHGHFQSVGELLQLAQMDKGKFEKLKPYLMASP
jgi:competence protein ComEA